MSLLQTLVFRCLVLKMVCFDVEMKWKLYQQSPAGMQMFGAIFPVWEWFSGSVGAFKLSRNFVFATVIITSISLISLLLLPLSVLASIDLLSPAPEVLGIIGQFSQSQWISRGACERKQQIAKAKTDYWWIFLFLAVRV